MPIKLKSSGGGDVTLDVPSTASTYTLTIPAVTATVATTTGTLTNPTINGFTGDTSVINIGSGQLYKDASGNVGIGTSSPVSKLDVSVASGGVYQFIRTAGTTGSDFAYIASQAGTNYVYNIAYGNGGCYTYANCAGTYTIGTSTAQPLSFMTNNTERARIDSGGRFLVGTSSGAYPFTVVGTTGSLTGFTKSGTGGWIREAYTVSTSGTYYFDFFGVQGTGSQLGTISSNGTTMTYGTSSDVRMKENIVDAPSALNDVGAIQIRSFDWKSDNTHQKFGVIAQELIEVAPDAVQKGQTEEDMWGVGYANLVPMLVKAIQELKAKNDALEARLAALEAK